MRTASQRYVAFLLESPLMAAFDRYSTFINFFNWTMTYRPDSDIFAPYGSITPVDRKVARAQFRPQEFSSKR
jgi:hypothetical protein